MPHVTIADIQVFLDKNKLTIDENDTLEDEPTYADIVLSRVANAYTITGWTSETNTPTLVKRVIAMLIAAARYNKVYSEEDDAGNRYANKLEGRAYSLIDMIVSGQASLLDASLAAIPDFADPKFWPDDTTGALAVYNALGLQVGEPGSDDIKVRMSTTW